MRVEESLFVSARSPLARVSDGLHSLTHTAGHTIWVILVGLFLLSPGVKAEIQLPAGFIDEEVATGLKQPMSIQFAPDGRLFVTERTGTLRIIKDGELLATPFLSVGVTTFGSHGLMGISFDPNFETNGHLYIFYHAPLGPTGRATISRFRASGDNPEVVEPGSELIIYDQFPNGEYNHFREIPFGPDGKLYVGGYYAEGYVGEVRRLDPVNYPNVIPPDNPISGSPLWARGFRAPTSLVFDPVTGKLYANDAGWHEAERIRLVVRNGQSVIYSYDHPEHGGAITGGAFYQSDAFPKDYVGDYLFVDHVQQFIKRLKPDNTVVPFATDVPHPIDLKVGPDGCLYYTDLGVLADLGPTFRNPQPSGSVRRICYAPDPRSPKSPRKE